MKTQVIRSRSGMEFSLTDLYIIHINPCGQGFYIAERRAVKECRDGESFEYGIVRKPSFKPLEVIENVGMFSLGYGHINLGCQGFTGAAAKTLKKWAKSYKPKS